MIKINRYFIPYIAFLIVFGFRWNLLLSIIFIIIHEGAHYFLASKMGYKNNGINLSLNGASINLEDLDEASLKEKLFIFSIGPIFNLLAGIFFYFLYIYFKLEGFHNLFIINISLFLYNIIPVFPLDGGNILREILAYKLNYKKATKIVAIIGIIIFIIFIAIFIFIMLIDKVNLTVLMAAILLLFTSHKEYTSIPYVIMGDLVKKKIRFIKKGIIENRSVSVHYKQTMIQVLSNIDKNKYTIIWVLDDEMELIDYISEGEILKAIKEYGNITLEEYYNF